jgi:hypothetical protein
MTKTKIIFFSILLVLSVASGILLPSLANMAGNRTRFYGSLGQVNLQLPSNSTYPASGTPNHPTNLWLAAWDLNKRSTNGPADELLVFMWQPIHNHMEPVAVITDNAANAELWKAYWNQTYVWFPTVSPVLGPVNIAPNVILVNNKDLEVYTEDNRESSPTYWVNLTTAVTVRLPYFNATGVYTNQTFVLPALTMMFKATSDSFQADQFISMTGYPRASDYTLTRSGEANFAGVSVSIPDWMGAGYSDDVTGRIYWRELDLVSAP